MARPPDVTHVVFQGHLGSSEVFNTGFWLEGNAPATDALANVLAANIAAASTSSLLADHFGALMSTDCGTDSVKVYGYPSSVGGAQGIGEAPIAGGVGQGPLGNPLQLCLVATLLTASASRAGRGRMYWPLTSQNAVASHVCSQSLVTQAADTLAVFFSTVNLIPGGAKVSVVSATHGVTNDVTSVRIDDKPDIQRRHANKLIAPFTRVAVLT